jgi:hypothetical protein
VRLQEGLWRLFLVCATHLPLTLRPASFWVNAKLTLACSLRVKENVVPTGDFFFLLICASLLPSLQVEWDWAAFATVGTGGGGGGVAAGTFSVLLVAAA